MSEPIRCPSCGAMNAAGAQWCGQCLARFDASPAEAPVEPVAPPIAPPAETNAAPDATPALRPVPSDGVHRRGDELYWTCPACQATNAMTHTSCPVCGTSMAVLFGATKKRGPKRTGPAVVALSAVLPGAGHAYAGKAADAVARGVLFVWTATIGIYLLTRDTARGGGVFKAIGGVFAITAAGTWVLSMLEAQRLSQGHDQALVPGKALLWTSAALTGLLFVGLAAGART